MKKFFSIILVSLMLCAFFISASAETGKYTAEIADLSKYFTDTASWNCDKEAIKTDGKTTELNLSDSRFYTNNSKKFKNEVLHFNFNSEFYDTNGCVMFTLRAQKELEYPWGSGANDCILFVLKRDQIELQRFSSGAGNYLQCVPNPIEDWSNVEVIMGAVNIDSGTHIFMNLNGINVISYTDKTVDMDEGYFSVEAPKVKCTFSSVSEKASGTLPVDFIISENDDDGSLTTEYNILCYGEAKKTALKERWVTSETDISLLNVHAVSETGIEDLIINREKETENIISLEDDGKYIVAVLECENNIYYSVPYYVDYASVIMKNGVYMLDNWYIAVADGERKMIDDKTIFVAPKIEDKKTYLPLRFVVENLGGSVTWNEDDNTVLINLNDKSGTLDIKKGLLYSEGQEYSVDAYINYGRTMLEAAALCEYYNEAVYVEEKSKIIVVGRELSAIGESVADNFKKGIKYGN